MTGGAPKTWSTPITPETTVTVPCPLCSGRRFAPEWDCGGFAYVRCRGCGLLQMNPQPALEAVAARYGERHGADYLAYELANEPAFLALQRLTLADLGFPDLEAGLKAAAAARGKPPAVLDVGCATGALLADLRDRGWDARGVELCAPSAAYARSARGLDVRACSLEAAAWPEAAFDLVHASHLIEHLNAPRAFLDEVRRVLAPGGRLIVTTPNAAGWQARWFGPAWRSAIFDHLYLFSLKTLNAMLAAAGFRVERRITWGGLAAGAAPPALKKIADPLAKRLGGGDVMAILAARTD